jgi:hypothetical protein
MYGIARDIVDRKAAEEAPEASLKEAISKYSCTLAWPSSNGFTATVDASGPTFVVDRGATFYVNLEGDTKP